MTLDKNLYSVQKKAVVYFLCAYIFLSGFVFREPALSEIFIIIFLPFLIVSFWYDFKVIFSFLLLYIFTFISLFNGLVQGIINIGYLTIDIYFFIVFLVVYCLFKFYNKEEIRNNLDTIMKWWTAAGLLNVVICILVFLNGGSTLFGIEIIKWGIRFRGFFKDPNVMAPFLIVPILYLMECFLLQEKKRIIRFCYILLLSGGVFLSFSRAAWLNLFVGIIFILFIYRKNFDAKIIIGIIIFLLIIFGAFLYLFQGTYNILGPIVTKYMKTRFQLQGYDIERFSAQRKTLSALDRNPLFGIGPGNSEVIATISTHSLYIRLLGEHGYIGFIIFIIFTLLSFGGMIELYKIYRKYAFFAISFIGLLINSFFIDSWHWRHFWFLIALGISFAWNCRSSKNKLANSSNKPYQNEIVQ